jgi:N-acetylmuramoyl-L-alanine amidase
MHGTYGDQGPADRPIRRFIARNLALLTFLAVATGVMLGAYFYFSPASGVAEVVAAGSSSGALSAPFAKPLPPRPILQRLPQSPGPIRIGIISGHKGNDSGAVCEDGLTEAEVNENIAVRVVSALQTRGIAADLLTEFDPRLQGYVATGLVSIHADSCDYINDLATGFKIAGSSFTDSSRLSICVEGAYQQATGMQYHANTITLDMTDYQAFRQISPGVPAIIIEVGFMNLDREMLTNQPDLLAGAITTGIFCYIDQIRGSVSAPQGDTPPAASPPEGG